MTFEELVNYVSDVQTMYSTSSIRLGCDCGCGGDFYEAEDLNAIDEDGEYAKAELKKLGVTFNDD